MQRMFFSKRKVQEQEELSVPPTKPDDTYKGLKIDFKRNYRFYEVFFPKAVGMALDGDDLMVTLACKRTFKTIDETVRIPNFLSGNIDDVRLGIDNFRRSLNEVVFSYPRQNAFVREIEFPGGNLAELRSALKYQLDSFLPFTPDEAYYDVHKAGGTNDQKQKMLIVAVMKEDMDKIMDRLALIGVIPTKVVISPMSLNSVIGETIGTVATIIKRNNKYCYSTFLDGTFHSSLAFDHEEQMMKKIQTDTPDLIMKNNGISLTDNNVSKRQVNDDINNDGTSINSKSIEISDIDHKKESLGAALYGINHTGDKFSILNTGRKGVRLQRSLAIGFIATLVFVLLFVPHVLKKRKLEALDIVNSEIRNLKGDIGRIEDIQSRLTEMEDTLQSVGKIRAIYVPRIEILRELSVKLPRNAWIKELYISKNNFEIGGIARSATDLIPILEKSALFSNVGLSAPVINTEKGKESFRLRGEVNVLSTKTENDK